MKTKIYKIRMAFLFIAINITHLTMAQNLIKNSSFENNTLPSGQDWFGINETDTSFFSHDVPPGGDNWSLRLDPGWIPAEGYAETYITGQSGTNIYLLKAWMKTIDWSGGISLYPKSQPLNFTNSQIGDTTTVWKHYSVIDTVTIPPGDSLVVHLTAGYCEVCFEKVLYDLVELFNITDSLTGTTELKTADEIKVYPNPNTGEFTLEIEDAEMQDVNFIITSIDGRLLLKEKLGRSGRIFRKQVNVSQYPKGIYNLSIATNKEMIHKKVIIY